MRQRLREQKARSAEGGAAAAERQEEPFASAFAGVSSTLSWSTFHLVHTRWLAQVDAMAKSPDKNWEVQVRQRRASSVQLSTEPAAAHLPAPRSMRPCVCSPRRSTAA